MKFLILKSTLGTAGREQVGEERTEREAEKRVKHLRNLATTGATPAVYYWYEPSEGPSDLAAACSGGCEGGRLASGYCTRCAPGSRAVDVVTPEQVAGMQPGFTPILDGHLTSGTLRLVGRDYVGTAADGTAVTVGSYGDELACERYLTANPTSDKW